MGNIIKKFSDGFFLEFDKGSIDSWCIYMNKPDGTRRAPLDRDYFSKLKVLGDSYGPKRVYDDFVAIYDATTRAISPLTLEKITEISKGYNGNSLEVDKLFTVLYMAMTAEENYPNTKLGRKIKRLAAYEILINEQEVNFAVNFMRGKNWRDIAKLCQERGF